MFEKSSLGKAKHDQDYDQMKPMCVALNLYACMMKDFAHSLKWSAPS